MTAKNKKTIRCLYVFTMLTVFALLCEGTRAIGDQKSEIITNAVPENTIKLSREPGPITEGIVWRVPPNAQEGEYFLGLAGGASG